MIVLAGIKRAGANIVGYRILGVDVESAMENGVLVDRTKCTIKDTSVNGIITLVVQRGCPVLGVEITNGEISGSNGSLDRYGDINTAGKTPLVVVARYKTANETMYCITNASGKVFNVPEADALKYAIQNGIANGKVVDKDGVKFISAIVGEYPTVDLDKNKLAEQVSKTEPVKTVEQPKVEEAPKPAVAEQPKTVEEPKTIVQPEKEISEEQVAKANELTASQIERANEIKKNMAKRWADADYDLSREFIRVNQSEVKNGANTSLTDKDGMSVAQKMALSIMTIQQMNVFFHSMLMAMKMVACGPGHQVNTMAVSAFSKTLYYNTEFVNGLTVSETIFVLIHEMYHILFCHATREGEGYNHSVWNVATDLYVNKYICEQFGLKGLGDATEISADSPFVLSNDVRGIRTAAKKIGMPKNGLYRESVDTAKDTPETIYKEEMKAFEQIKNAMQQMMNNMEKNSGQNNQSGGQSGQNGEQDQNGDKNQSGQSGQRGDNSQQNQSGQGGQSEQQGQSGQRGDNSQQNQSGQGSENQSGQQGQDGQGSENQNEQQSGQSGQGNDDNNDSSNQNGQGGQNSQDGQNNQTGQGGQNGSQSGQQNNQQSGQSGQSGQNDQQGNQSGQQSGQNSQGGQDGQQSGSQQSGEQSGNQQSGSQQSGGQQSGGQQNGNQNGQNEQNGDQDGQGDAGLSSDNGRTATENEAINTAIREYAQRRFGKDLDHDIVNDTEGKLTDDKKRIAKENIKNIVEVAHTAQKMAGQGTDPNLERIIKKIMMPKIDFRTLLQHKLNVLSDKVESFRAFSRRDGLNPGVIMPGKATGEPSKLRAVMGIDNSASLDPDDLAYAYGYCVKLCSQLDVELELVFWNTEVSVSYILEKPTDINKVINKGGGGTDVECLFKYISQRKRMDGSYRNEKVDVLMVVTDGYFPQNYAQYRSKCDYVLWLLTNDGSDFEPLYGRVAQLKVDR